MIVTTLARHAFRPQALLPLAVLLLLAVGHAALAEQVYLDAIGFMSGSQFLAPCPPDQNLHGLELRVGHDVDAVRPVCVQSQGPAAFLPPELTTGSGLLPEGHPFPWELARGWHGGIGGVMIRLLCPASTPIVVGVDIGAESDRVNNVRVFCGQAKPIQYPPVLPSAIFDGPSFNRLPNFSVPNRTTEQAYAGQRCPALQVAVGVHGRVVQQTGDWAGVYLGALGLICATHRISIPPPPRPVVSSVGKRHPEAPPGPEVPICERARLARERNSPAANQLEAWCKSENVVSSVGRAKPVSDGGPPPSVCDQAAAARDRSSPAAEQLAAKCRALGGQLPPPPPAVDLGAMAAKGEAVAAQDPLLAQLREKQPAGAMRRGFDIALGASEGQTAWGPGKQKILDSLPLAEQEGFKVAISFVLDRNRYLERALIGAAIAAVDPEAETTRRLEPDARYALGFDIASAIFGDPALGAQGNTATGPGSLGIRDSLSPPAQRGFDAAVRLHLGRKY